MTTYGLTHRIARKQDRLFDRVRDPRALEAATGPATAADFEALSDAEYALLVTFRRSGQPVPTPVWFGLDTVRLYVRSLADAGKVKRVRGEPRVHIAPCTIRGRPLGPLAAGAARILSPDESQVAESALDRHYGLRRRLYEGLGGRLGVQTVYLEITPASRPPAVRAFGHTPTTWT
jgi:uncharacterized protein